MLKRFIRWMNFNPPWAATGDEWNDFHQRFKEEAPVRHWLYEAKIAVRVRVQRAMRIFDEVRYRLVRYHIIDTGLKPGYYNKDYLMLHANFQILVNYVEVELAFQQDGQEDIHNRVLGFSIWRKIRHYVPFYVTFRELTFRSPEKGLKHLEWESGLDDPNLPPDRQSPQQAKRAREIRDLYLWWTVDRPRRQEPVLDPEVDDYLDGKGLFYSGSAQFRQDHPEYARKYDEWMQEYHSYDAYCDIEDEDKLLQLIKLRKSLWT